MIAAPAAPACAIASTAFATEASRLAGKARLARARRVRMAGYPSFGMRRASQAGQLLMTQARPKESPHLGHLRNQNQTPLKAMMMTTRRYRPAPRLFSRPAETSAESTSARIAKAAKLQRDRRARR